MTDFIPLFIELDPEGEPKGCLVSKAVQRANSLIMQQRITVQDCRQSGQTCNHEVATGGAGFAFGLFNLHSNPRRSFCGIDEKTGGPMF